MHSSKAKQLAVCGYTNILAEDRFALKSSEICTILSAIGFNGSFRPELLKLFHAQLLSMKFQLLIKT